MKYKLIIFDFDGTLANTFPWFLTVADELADKFHLKRIDRTELDSLRCLGMRQMIKHLQVPAWKVPLISREIKSMQSKDLHRIPLFEGIEQILRNLFDQGITLAVVSSNNEKHIRHILGPEIESMVSFFECGVGMYSKKSKFTKIIKKSHIPSTETLCIGDEIRDLEAAKSANLDFGAVAWGYTIPEALMQYEPNILFNRVEDIFDFVV